MKSFPKSKQQTELLRSVPSSYRQCEQQALKSFVTWAEVSPVEKTPVVSLLIKQFASDAQSGVRLDLHSGENIGELLAWIEASREEHAFPDEAVPALSLFLSYQDDMRAYGNRIRNYWSN